MAPRPSAFYSFIALASWPLVRGALRLRATGLEHVPREGGFVLAANHHSSFDPWPLGMPLWPRRYLRVMAKSELYWFPMTLVLRGLGAFRVRRGQRDVEALETAERLCREGHAVVMFPEGTRRRKGLFKTREARAHTGAARIAIAAGVPLVPAAIAGTDSLARLARLRVAYGAPIQLEGLDAQEATDRLMAEIDRLEASL